MEDVSHSKNEKPEVRIRCRSCIGVPGWLSTHTTCKNCLRNLKDFSKKGSNTNTEQSESSDTENFKYILENILPTAPQAMKTLLKAQIEALNVSDKLQMRWDQEILIKVCLNLWSRSPKSDEDLLNSGILILPS
jgi:hypothetical protein